MNSDSPHLRFAIVGIVTVSLFASLFARLWFLQVMTSPQYEVAARNNAVRNVQEEAARGRILDRQGRVLVDNRRSIQVAIDWQAYNALDKPVQSSLLTRLARTMNRFALLAASGTQVAALGSNNPADWPVGALPSTTTTPPTTAPPTTAPPTTPTPGLNPSGEAQPALEPMTAKKLVARLNNQRFSHFKPVPVATGVSVELEIYLAEHADDYPAVRVDRVTVRQYHYGSLLAHVLGYVGQAGPDDLKQFQNKTKPYELSDEVGKAGMERTMEAQLRGTPGLTRIEVDARNKPVRQIPVRKPVPGNDVYLSVDIGLQYLVERSLAVQLGRPTCTRDGCSQAKTGAAVVTDPNNGQVLAMASYPTYDPNVWTGGISDADYAYLQDEANGSPSVDRAISGQYAPGSTWKLFSAYAGLSNGLITPTDVVVDDGAYQVPDCNAGKCEFTNAGRTPHGPVDLTRALTVSSDVYFYRLGDNMWRSRGRIGPNALAESYAKWGFGAKPGSGLPGESAGRLASPAQKKELAEALYKGDQKKIEENSSWRSGDNMNTAIGQGDVEVTPLQLANGYAAFANGGTLYRPDLVLQVNESFSEKVLSVATKRAERKIDLPLAWQLPMVAGFVGVTQDTYGTARETFAGFPNSLFPVAGKTGTAQVNKKVDTSLFAAFAPANAPKFAIAVILPEAGNGGSAAAPAVARILEPVAAVGGDLSRLKEPPPGGAFDPNAPDDVVAPPTGGID